MARQSLAEENNAKLFQKKQDTSHLLLIVIIGTISFLVVRNARPEPSAQFQTSGIQRGNLTATIGATGTVRSKQSAVLLWQSAGTVESVDVKVGESVKDDEIPAELAKTSLSQNIILANGHGNYG